ncbi:MAG: hypothetical protein HYW00_00855 [Candidatus Colwellbacteria bacterium]|nr:hypothetical protein [Candidatus Colwellbacteria bacterium]
MNEPVLKKETIHGYPVRFDESIKDTGIYHLRYHLEPQEAKTLLDAARSRGKAYFEDRENRNYTLIHRSDGTFELMGREHDR